jgi:hypothetical protein
LKNVVEVAYKICGERKTSDFLKEWHKMGYRRNLERHAKRWGTVEIFRNNGNTYNVHS